MTEKERFAEIAETVMVCIDEVRKLEKQLLDKGLTLDLSELFYHLGYIEGLCGKEGEDE